MKTQLLKKIGFITLILVLTTVINFSCGKKEEEENHELTITLKYTPNPAVKNTPITFTVEVEQMGEHISVSDFSCELKKDSAMTMTLSQSETGHYVGTQTFTASGSYNLKFKYMHDSMMASKDFTVAVQ